MQTLSPNTLLQGEKYQIVKILGQGGFGITYLAIQRGLDRKVAIKEFFMKEMCERDATTSRVTLGTSGSRATVQRFRDKFLKEARNIAKLNHPNIVRIIDVFEENGTAYYVMEYAEGGSLADKVNQKGHLTEAEAQRYIRQVADALGYIHQLTMNHLDIKPTNIVLNEKDEAVIIDFGLAKQYDSETGNQTSSTPVGISEGYAPMEQYKQSGVGQFSPATDIYSLGATFYKLVTGQTPPSAMDLSESGLPDFQASAPVKAAIVTSMQHRRADRPQSVGEWLQILDGKKDAPAENPAPVKDGTAGVGDIDETHLQDDVQETKLDVAPHPDPAPDKEKETDVPVLKKSRKGIVIGILVALITASLTWALYYYCDKPEDEEDDEEEVDELDEDDDYVDDWNRDDEWDVDLNSYATQRYDNPEKRYDEDYMDSIAYYYDAEAAADTAMW